MPDRLSELHQQRGRLIERIAGQRSTLERQMGPLRNALNLGDRISEKLHEVKSYLQRHPLALLGGIGALVLLRPRGLLRFAQRGLLAWRTWHNVRHFLPASLAERIGPGRRR